MKGCLESTLEGTTPLMPELDEKVVTLNTTRACFSHTYSSFWCTTHFHQL